MNASCQAAAVPSEDESSSETTTPQAPASGRVDDIRKRDRTNAVQQAVLDVIRQAGGIDFWVSQLLRTFASYELNSEISVTDQRFNNATFRAALKAMRKSYDTFEVSWTEKAAEYDPDRISFTIEIKLHDYSEWKDAVREAWGFSETPNQHGLSDNALKLYQWAKGPKYTDGWIQRNSIGAQAGLRKSYFYMDRHLEEIQAKADPTIRWETDNEFSKPKFRIWFANEPTSYYNYGPLNPLLGLDVQRDVFGSSGKWREWLHQAILGPSFPEARETVGIFDISDRKTALKVFSSLPANCGEFGPLPSFFEKLRLIEGISIQTEFRSGAGPWLVAAVPEEGVTWKQIKERLLAKHQEIPLGKKYRLSPPALALLRWIGDLHESEFLLGMTPTVEPRLKSEIGIETKVDERNLRVYLDLLVDEINEHTEFMMRTIPWHSSNRFDTRILVKKKPIEISEIAKTVRLLALQRNRVVDLSEIRKAIENLIANKSAPQQG
jgi:hypothetical protein